MSKRALLVGINYRGTSSELSGCINDVTNVKKYRSTQGYSESKIVMLTDDTDEKPTRANILGELMALITSSSSHLYFHYSGHGGSIRDRSGDEKDGRDECIFPIDSNRGRIILDDEWRAMLRHLRKDQRLLTVLDCCHSGTGMDLAYNLYQQFAGHGLRLVKDSSYPTTRGKVIMLSGCLDPQTSADAFEEGQAQGALTYALLKTLRHNKKITYEQLILKVRKLLKKKGYPQIPTLSAGRKLKLNKKVNL